MHTPITAFYAGLLAFLFLYLSFLVIGGRRAKQISLGDNGDKNFARLVRAHGNFAEYTPLILVLMLVAELNQANDLTLHIAGVLLLFGRFIHSHGLRYHGGVSWQRVTGMILTFTAMFVLAVLNLLVLYK